MSSKQIDRVSLVSIPSHIFDSDTVDVPLLDLLMVSLFHSTPSKTIPILVRVFNRRHLVVLLVVKEYCCHSVMVVIFVTTDC